jgi:hypothetical protein
VNESFDDWVRSQFPPISLAEPVMTLNTPFGAGAFSKFNQRQSGFWRLPAGFKTTVQPAPIAGPALQVIMANGKFHGVIRTLQFA